MFTELDDKSKTKIARLWNLVLDREMYLVADSTEEYKELVSLHGPLPFIMEKNIHAFSTDKQKAAFQELVSILRDHAGNHLFSWSSVYETVKKKLTRVLVDGEGAKASQMLSNIAEALREMIHPQKVLLPISGIELHDCVIEFNNWKIEHFNSLEIDGFMSKVTDGPDWKDSIHNILSKDYIGRPLFQIFLEGEHAQAAENAVSHLRYVLNTLRFAALMHGEDHYNARTVRIGIDTHSARRDWMISFREDCGQVGFRTVPGELTGPFKITMANLETYRYNLKLQNLWELYDQQQKTDLELAIIDALKWIGEAQNENDRHIAFIKYWTSLEALLTGYQNDKITDRLSISLPPILGQVAGERPPSKNMVRKMYSLRSDMLHGRGLTDISCRDLCTVSKWASNCLLVCLDLRSRGYNTRETIFGQSARIAKVKQNPKGQP